MPRKHRAARERSGPPPKPDEPGWAPPSWALAPDVEVRAVSGDKVYRCPGCDMEIRAGVPHLVVVPLPDPSLRRHWHTECWRRELRRTGGSFRGGAWG
jgi:hypothetical protein